MMQPAECRSARQYLRVFVACSILLVGSSTALAAPDSVPPASTSIAMTDPTFQHRHFTASDGARLHVIEAGRALKGRPVIALVPGWSMPAMLWRAQLAGLSSQYKVVALDPRGQGESDIPPSGYTLRQRSDDIRRFVNRATDHGGKVVLVAWSLGALETLEYLRKHGASRIAALVIVDSSVGEGPAAESPPASPSQPPPPSFSDELRNDRAKAVGDFVAAIFRTPQSQQDLDALRDAALRMPLEASLSLFPSRVPREHWRKIVHRVRQPLLYMVTPQFAAQADILQATRPGTRVEVFQDAGHALFVDEPARFNALLDEFVASLPVPGRPRQ
jgi:non-heme chloroperoxidase